MLKKIGLVITTAVFLAACNPTQQSSTPQNNDAANQFSQVSQALQAGGSAVCTITNPDGTETIEYAAKGTKVRVSSTGGADMSENLMISDGQNIYTWNTSTLKGVRFPIPDTETTEQAANIPSVPDLSQEADQEQFLQQGYTINCTVTDVPDSEFVPPTNVNFEDMTQMMQNAQQMMNNAGNKMPTAEQQQQLQDQAQQMMQRYNQ